MGLASIRLKPYLQRGRPSAQLLVRCGEETWNAMATVPAAAQVHILHGMLWRVDGYSPSTVVEKLATVSGSAVSDAAQWLAWAAGQAPELELGPAVDFWEGAVETGLGAEQYKGFGFFAGVERLEAIEA
jgi:hypothetical protein